MPYIISDKIRVGISACNFGGFFRWNRAGWDRVGLLEREKDAFIWTPVCPEVMAGLGVPRDPIKLSGGNGDDVWAGQARVKNKRGREVTAELKAGALAALEALERAGVEAFVYMDGSPSCGVYRTTLKDQRAGKPPGVFGSLLLKQGFFLIPVLDLDSPVKWWDWRRRLHAFCWLKRAEIGSKKTLYDIWHEYKFLCQEINDAEARTIGRSLSELPARVGASTGEAWRRQVLELLRRPVPFNRITNSLVKHCAHFRKHAKTGSTCLVPGPRTGKREFAKAIMAMEKEAYAAGLTFGSAPVIYRSTSR